MKTAAIDYHFIKEQVQLGALRVSHVSLVHQIINALTKPQPKRHSQN